MHSKYFLPVVKVGSTTYSGLNMGAGENALFEIFKVIHEIGTGGLIVVDELELGLHVDSQRRLMAKLKETCLKEKVQIIFTTHSKEIFSELPDDARFFLETRQSNSFLSTGISPEFAMNKMGSKCDYEGDIYVEDGVAESLLALALPHDIRKRVNIVRIGSAQCVARQLAACYIRDKNMSVMAIFDGDQTARHRDNLSHAQDMAENPDADFSSWFNARCSFLPGNTWPESWIIQKTIANPDSLATKLKMDESELVETLEQGLLEGKHKEFGRISDLVGMDEVRCLDLFTQNLVEQEPDEFGPLVDRLNQWLEHL